MKRTAFPLAVIALGSLATLPQSVMADADCCIPFAYAAITNVVITWEGFDCCCGSDFNDCTYTEVEGGVNAGYGAYVILYQCGEGEDCEDPNGEYGVIPCGENGPAMHFHWDGRIGAEGDLICDNCDTANCTPRPPETDVQDDQYSCNCEEEACESQGGGGGA